MASSYKTVHYIILPVESVSLYSNAKRNTLLYSKFYAVQDDIFLSHKFAFSNLRFSPFYEHFRQLREKYAFKLKIKYIMLISSLSPI